ncbi:hypothetical protein lerEdw1_000414 [Lerista edwardsae]|nr:hypothetical protein lerEdw1_000414 [Lerista edwardsae]
MADAFRIAFEQQLMRRKDHALGFAQMNKTCKKEAKLLSWKSLKEDGVSTLRGNRKSLGQKVMGMLASGADSKKIRELDNPQEIIRMLIDLLNDKEEALAHQRKVSYMLARTLEEKENSLQQNKENKCLEELPLKNDRCKTGSASQDLAIPACSCCQACIAQDSSCSTSSNHIVQHSAGTTESSCFSTPVPVHCTENDMCERKETIDTN